MKIIKENVSNYMLCSRDGFYGSMRCEAGDADIGNNADRSNSRNRRIVCMQFFIPILFVTESLPHQMPSVGRCPNAACYGVCRGG